MTTYSKPPLNVDDQIKLLISRGLVIKDQNFAKHILSNISYYRLSNYFYHYWEDKITHKFYSGVTLEDVVEVYNFDKEIREVCFKAIEVIEISMRAKLSLFLSQKYSSNWFCNENLAENKENFNKIIGEIKDLSHNTKEQFVRDHFAKYKDEYLPSWKLMEITSLGLLSRIYGNIKSSLSEKKAIAKSLALPNHLFLVGWLKSISNIRNICAHHSRLWDKTLSTPIKIPHKLNKLWISQKTQINVKNNKLYIALCCIKYLLNNIEPNNVFADDVVKIIEKYPNIDLAKMNFPEGWQEDKFWK